MATFPTLLEDLQIRVLTLLGAKDVAAVAQSASNFGSEAFTRRVVDEIASSLYPDFAGRAGKSERALAEWFPSRA